MFRFMQTIQYQTNSKQSQRNKPKWHETEQNATNAHKSAELLQKTKNRKMLFEEPKTTGDNRGATGDNRGATGDNRGRPQKRTIYLKFGHFFAVWACFELFKFVNTQIVQTRPNCSNLKQFRPLWARLDMFGLVSNCFHLFGPVSSKICKLSLISNYLDLPGLF